MQQQGRQANMNGAVLEQQIISRIKHAGYGKIKDINNNFFYPDKYYITQYKIGMGIYKTPLYTDVLLFDKIKYPNKLAIEMKWQQTAGSIDEKYPYLVLNIKEIFPCPAIIVIDGGGYKDGAIEWLKNQIDTKLIGVYDLSGFLKWSNNGGL